MGKGIIVSIFGFKFCPDCCLVVRVRVLHGEGRRPARAVLVCCFRKGKILLILTLLVHLSFTNESSRLIYVFLPLAEIFSLYHFMFSLYSSVYYVSVSIHVILVDSLECARLWPFHGCLILHGFSLKSVVCHDFRIFEQTC